MSTPHTTPETQPEALRLANYLEKEWVTGDCLNAARELRRLHAENSALADDLPPPAPPREPLPDLMRQQMKENCGSMETRGAFVDGWTSAEAAHGIKEGS